MFYEFAGEYISEKEKEKRKERKKKKEKERKKFKSAEYRRFLHMEAQPPALCAMSSSRRARHGREQTSHSTIYSSLKSKTMSTYPHSDLQRKKCQLTGGCQHKTEKDSQLFFRIFQ